LSIFPNSLSLNFIVILVELSMIIEILRPHLLQVLLSVLIYNFAKTRRGILFRGERLGPDSSISTTLLRRRNLRFRKAFILKKHLFLLLAMLDYQI